MRLLGKLPVIVAVATLALQPVDRGHVMVGEQFAPAPIDEDHHLGHELVERRTAFALGDRDAIAGNVEHVLGPVVGRAALTAIGFEPSTPDLDTALSWQRAMQGHAVSNFIPVVAANRIGIEKNPASGAEQGYYGKSFIANPSGDLVEEADRKSDAVLVHTFDLDAINYERPMWGFFRDRRTDLYKELL